MSAATVFGPGHPDQACDLVVAAVVEDYLRRDPESHLNIRACGGKGALFLAGEVSSTADFDVSMVVKQTLATCGVLGTIEPFIAFEPMAAAWTKALGNREPVTVQGYATEETPELLPVPVVLARALASALEDKRTKDQDWFWLGADYEVTVVSAVDAKPFALIRAEHLDSYSLEQVRTRIQSLCAPLCMGGDIRVNPGGEETQAGLAHRIGSSGRNSFDLYARIPIAASGVGLSLRHPKNAGAAACRSIARRLVKAGHGKAVAVRATWLPLETRPSFVRAWSEAGKDLSHEIQESELDLTRLPPAWSAPELATAFVRQGTDSSIQFPWDR